MKLYNLTITEPQRKLLIETITPSIEMYEDLQERGTPNDMKEANEQLPILKSLKYSLEHDIEETERIPKSLQKKNQ